MNETIAALVAAEVRGDLERSKLDFGPESIKLAFRVAKGHFMAPGNDEIWLGGVAGLMDAFPDKADEIFEEGRKVKRQMELIGAVSSGIPIDWDALEGEVEHVTDQPLGLQKIFKEVISG